MRRIMITGASGNIGRHLLPLLAAENNVEVLACSRQPSRAEQITALGCTAVALDFDKPATFAETLRGVDTAFLLKPYTIKMLIQAKQFLDAAKAAGVRRIVHLGAHGADDIPWAIIGWHHMVERYVEALGFDWTHLRPNFFMENLLKGAKPEAGELYHYLRSDIPVSWIGCRDIARAAAAALLDPAGYREKKVHLAGDPHSLDNLASLLSEVSGKRYRYVRLPRETGFNVMTNIGREPEFVNPWLDYMAGISDGAVAEIAACYPAPGPDNRLQPITLRAFLTEHRQAFL